MSTTDHSRRPDALREEAAQPRQAGPSRPRTMTRYPSHTRRQRSASSPPLTSDNGLLFPSLTPMLSRLSARSPQPPKLDDGFDNYPPPLPSDPVLLERVLTEHPDVTRQMVGDDPDVGPPPDGGFEAWAVVASTVFVLFCVHGLVTSFGVFQAHYLSNQLRDYSQSQVAWIASVQLTLTFAGSLLSGRYFDANGTRLLIMLGWCFSIGALVGLAFATEYYQFMLAHACFGISGSILYTPATAVVGHWFLRKRGTATGLVSTGVGLGGVIYPIMLNRLFERWSFRNSILVLAGMNAILMLPALIFLKARLPRRTPPPLRSLVAPFKEIRYTMLVVGSVTVMMSWFVPYFNAPLLTSSNRLSPTIQSYSVTILQAGSMTGRASCGFLADRIGVYRVFVGSAVGCGITLLAFWTGWPLPAPVVVIGLFVYGLMSGPWITLVPTACAAISPVKELGMRVGMIWSLSGFTLLAGPVIGGQLVMLHSNRFTYAGIFCAVAFLLGAFLIVSPRALEMVREKRDHSHNDGQAGLGHEGMAQVPLSTVSEGSSKRSSIV